MSFTRQSGIAISGMDINWERTVRAARLSLTLLLCCALFLLAATAAAQGTADGYPSRPIRILSPYTPGGLSDGVLRAIGQHLLERLGQPVFIENRPGASQLLALDAAAKSPPDGHTLVFATHSGLVLLTVARKTLPYDPLRNFASIGVIYETPLYLVVHPSVSARSVLELIALAKSQPRKLFYASIGTGSHNHLMMEMFKTTSSLDMVHVPYKGNSQAQTGLLAGEVQLMFEGSSILTQVRRGKLRPLASTGRERTQATPDLPTVREAGVPGFERLAWFGLAAPAGVPRPIIERLNRELGDMLRSPSMREKFAAFNIELTPSTPEEMTERIRSEIPMWSKIMRAAGIEQE